MCSSFLSRSAAAVREVASQAADLFLNSTTGIVPVAASTAVSWVISDSSVKKVVVGVGYTLSAVCIVLRNKVDAAVTRLFRQAPANHGQVNNRRLSPVAIVAGYASLWYGVYMAGTGIIELYNRYQKVDDGSNIFDLIHQRYPICHWEYLQEPPEDALLMATLVAQARQCSALNKLWNEVAQQGPFSTHLVPEIPEGSKDSSWDACMRVVYFSRSIVDLPDHPSKFFGRMSHELCYARWSDTNYLQMRLEASKGDMDPKEYVRRRQQALTQPTVCSSEIAKACIGEKQWTGASDIHAQDIEKIKRPFEEIWEEYGAAISSDKTNPPRSSIANFLYEWQKDHCAVFCAKHPEEGVCVEAVKQGYLPNNTTLTSSK